MYDAFSASLDANKISIWEQKSCEFRDFWDNKLANDGINEITEQEIDEIVKILDRNGKGNTKNSIAVARVMVPQGAWRRMFLELKANGRLRNILTEILNTTEESKLMNLIDALYKENAGKKNNLTGPTASVVNAMLFAYNPEKYVSVVSLNDRKRVIDFFKFSNGPDFERDTPGRQCVLSNRTILEGFHQFGITAHPRAISLFLYKDLQPYWKGDVGKMKIGKEEVEVSIPEEDESETKEQTEAQRDSIVIQAKIAQIGEALGFKIWLPISDRSRVTKLWEPKQGSLLEELPLISDESFLKTVRNIDVLWIKQRFIARAFEVEDKTSIYSGILRMADLLALQPNLTIKTHIVARPERKEKVFNEVRRPVFSDIGGRRLSDICSYLSYDFIKQLAVEKNLKNMNVSIIDDNAESPTNAFAEI